MNIVTMQTDELKPWERNPRLNDHAVSAVAESIRTFGFNVPILCDQHLTIIAGHTRLKAAKSLGMREVPVIVLDITDEQRKAFAIADNRTSEIADWDMPKLRAILEELDSEDFDLRQLGFSDTDLRRILSGSGADEDEIPRTSEVPRAKEGDLYALGAHRLLCGNSCDGASPRTLDSFRAPLRCNVQGAHHPLGGGAGCNN